MGTDTTMVIVMDMIVILVAMITMVMGIPIEVMMAVTGITIIADQGMDPVTGDEIKGQGESPASHWGSSCIATFSGQ
jgi:hypothetical protein